jgi:hypothetical protein
MDLMQADKCSRGPLDAKQARKVTVFQEIAAEHRNRDAALSRPKGWVCAEDHSLVRYNHR